MKRIIIALAAIAGILLTTAGVANATTRATWAVYVKSNMTGKTLKVDWPFYTLTSAQTDKAREQTLFNKYCTILPATCATASIRQLTG